MSSEVVGCKTFEVNLRANTARYVLESVEELKPFAHVEIEGSSFEDSLALVEKMLSGDEALAKAVKSTVYDIARKHIETALNNLRGLVSFLEETLRKMPEANLTDVVQKLRSIDRIARPLTFGLLSPVLGVNLTIAGGERPLAVLVDVRFGERRDPVIVFSSAASDDLVNKVLNAFKNPGHAESTRIIREAEDVARLIWL